MQCAYWIKMMRRCKPIPLEIGKLIKKKQAIESNPSLKMRLQMLRRRKLGQDAIDAAKKDNKL